MQTYKPYELTEARRQQLKLAKLTGVTITTIRCALCSREHPIDDLSDLVDAIAPDGVRDPLCTACAIADGAVAE
jgi:hypothetical protein